MGGTTAAQLPIEGEFPELAWLSHTAHVRERGSS
jgi:hypothetical protein